MQRALAPLKAEGWRLRHSLPWQGLGDIDSVAIAPPAFAVVIETKTRTYDSRHLARVREQAVWMSRRRRRWARNGALGVVCTVRARGVERVEQGILVVSVDRLAHVLRVASATGADTPSSGRGEGSRLGSTGLYPGSGDDDHRLPVLQCAQSRESDRSGSPALPAVQVQAALARRCGRRLVRGGDDCVRARSRRFLGDVVRALSDDLPRARGPGQASRGRPQGREGRRRREPRTRRQVWRAVHPVASRDPRRSRDRSGCRRASSRCAGATATAGARRLSVDPDSTVRQGGVSPGAELLGTQANEVRGVMARLQRMRSDSPATRGMLVGESDS